MALHHRQRASVRVPYIEGPEYPVYTARRHDSIVVLIPVVGQDLGRGCRPSGTSGPSVDGDGRRQVVLCRGRRAKIEDAEVRVGRHGGDQSGIGRAERGTVRAVANGQSFERELTGGRPLDTKRKLHSGKEQNRIGRTLPA